MTEQEILKALDGKFFRGPSTFYQSPIGVHDEVVPDPDETRRAIETERAARMARIKAEIQAREEQVEREVDVAPMKWRVPISMCVDAVCLAHGVTQRELLNHSGDGSRSRRLSAARQHVVWLIKALRPDATCTQISTRLNYRDHTTILYGVKKFEGIKSRYIPEIVAALEYIREKTGDKTICLL